MTNSNHNPLQSLMLQVARGEIDPARAAITIQTIIEQVALQLVKNQQSTQSSSSCECQSEKQNQHGSITRSEEQDCHCGCGGSCGSEKNISRKSNGQIDFASMTQAEKLAYNQAKRDQIFGTF